MKLIQELVENVEYITEDYAGTKRHYITGPMIMGDQLNRNKRVYPFEKVLRPATENFIREYVETGRAVGDLGHSERPDYTLKEVAAKIVSLERDGTNYNGKMLITEGTPNGAIAKGLLEAGIALGVSTKGGGGTEKGKFNGQECSIVKEFRLTGIDIVHDPSAHIAMVNHIMENSEWIWDAATGWVHAEELIETVQETVHKDIKTLNEDNAKVWFESFLDLLKFKKNPSDQDIAEHFAKGHAASQVAAALGCTRNYAIERYHRMPEEIHQAAIAKYRGAVPTPNQGGKIVPFPGK